MILLVIILISGCKSEDPKPDSQAEENTLIIFHNNQGSMCLKELEWLTKIKSENSDLVIKEHLTTEAGTSTLLKEMVAEFNQSKGVSNNFGYLPITIYRDNAFSGFDEKVKTELKKLMEI